MPAVVLLLFPVFTLLIVAGAVVAVVLITSTLGGGGPLIAKLLVLPVLAAIWYGIKDVRSLKVGPTEGIELTGAEHPKLWAEVNRLAEAAETAPPQRIVLVPEVNAAVTEAAGVRELLIGLPLVGGMNVGELRSVIAHELGHFAGGDTAKSARTMRRVYALYALPARAGFITRWFLVAYAKLYAYAAGPASRDMERAADQVAVRVAGPKVAADAMRTMARLDAAWAVLNHHFVGLFPLAGKRASLVEGMHHLMATNSEELGAIATEALTEERTSGAMTHPTLAERIATFEAAHARGEGAQPLPGGEAPAAELIAGGLEWLGTHEQQLFVQQLPLTTWDDVVTQAGRESIGADAVRCSEALAAAGVGSGTLSDAVALLETADLPPAGRLGALLTGGDADEADEAASYVLSTLVINALLVNGKARFEARWDAPERLVSMEGDPIDIEALVDAAVEDGGGVALRAWLTERGVDLAAPVRADELRPQWLGAMSNVAGSWAAQADVHIWSTGLLVLPLPEDVVKADKQRRKTEVQADRLQRSVSEGLDAGQRRAGSTWIAASAVKSAEMKSRMNLTVTLTMEEGTPVRLKATLETAMVPSPERVGWAIGQLFPSALQGSN